MVLPLFPIDSFCFERTNFKCLNEFKRCRTIYRRNSSEGPFINLEKGAQNPEYIRNPTIQEIEEIINEQVKLITMAPEIDNFYDVIDYLKEKSSNIIGHSSGGFEHFKRAFQSGVNRITHFSNALTPLHHRNMEEQGRLLSRFLSRNDL